MDFKGAYDTVWRNKLLQKLACIKVKENMLGLFVRFLSQRWTQVNYRNKSLEYKQTKLGLPQGAVSSTTLFNIFINDLPQLIKSLKGMNISMFADDRHYIDKMEKQLQTTKATRR